MEGKKKTFKAKEKKIENQNLQKYIWKQKGKKYAHIDQNDLELPFVGLYVQCIL